MDLGRILNRLTELEERIRTLEAENQQLRDENSKLKKRIAELEAANKTLESTLTSKAATQASKNPNINFGVARNKPKEEKEKKERKIRTPFPGRTPDDEKLKNASRIVDIYPTNISSEECVLRDGQGVWRFLDGMQAKYVHYRIWAPENAKVLPRIEGVRHRRSEYGIEIILPLGYLVYWIGISFDKACECIGFFTGLPLSKGQADLLLYPLAEDWKKEYKNVSKLITKAMILYVDETAWTVGKQNLYTWIFSTKDAVLYKVGVGRGKDVLDEMFSGVFAGIGVSDDYAAYDSAFTEHQ
jgi:regulator of replication initiation timing